MWSTLDHLELLQPTPPPNAKGALDADIAESRQCGYAFFRGSSAATLKPTIKSAQVMQLNKDNTSGFHYAPFNKVGEVSTENVARALAEALKRVSTDCVHVDISERAGGPEPLIQALTRHGIRSTVWRAPKLYPPVPAPQWLRPRPKPQVENLLRLYYARHSKLFFVEGGTCWGDVVTMLRSKSNMPTLTMRARAAVAELALDAVPQGCVRVRGTCVDTRKPFPYREKAKIPRHNGVC